MDKWYNIQIEPPFDKCNFTTRARAFKQTIFPSCARRILLQKKFGYGFMVAPTLNAMLKILKPFVKKLIRNNEYKAYYIVMVAFYDFLNTIGYVYIEDTLPLLLQENNEE